jgi:hypothetical protein
LLDAAYAADPAPIPVKRLDITIRTKTVRI